MSTNWYAQAIDVLADEDMDFKALCRAIAKKHPKVVVDAFRTMEPKKTNGRDNPWWFKDGVKTWTEARNKIEAIKALRAMTGWGLAQSKDAIDKLWQEKGI